MTALIAGRNTPAKAGDVQVGLVAAAVNIFAGAMLVRNASGHILPAVTGANLIGVGRAEVAVDNSGGAAGDATATFKKGRFRYANSAAADEITIADIGQPCFAVDDQTVAKTDDTGARSPAGIVEDVDDLGVWVDFNEALTRAAL
jgi:hypothetical protein